VNKEIVKKVPSPLRVRKGLSKLEQFMAKLPGAKFGDEIAPLKHTFADGCYIREITMPKGMLLTSKIHKIKHPYFILKGDCSVLTETGVVRLKAPFHGITMPGTKRLLYIHEETVWVTVHVTRKTDLKEIEKDIVAKTYEELPDDIKKQISENIDEIDETKLLEFTKKIKEE